MKWLLTLIRYFTMRCYLSKLTAYRLNNVEDYKAKMERMNTLYEDYIKGTC